MIACSAIGVLRTRSSPRFAPSPTEVLNSLPAARRAGTPPRRGRAPRPDHGLEHHVGERAHHDPVAGPGRGADFLLVGCLGREVFLAQRVVARRHGEVGRSQENGKLSGLLGDQLDRLRSGRTGADQTDALVGEVRLVLWPKCCVGVLAAEGIDARNIGQDGLEIGPVASTMKRDVKVSPRSVVSRQRLPPWSNNPVCATRSFLRPLKTARSGLPSPALRHACGAPPSCRRPGYPGGCAG